MLKTHIALALTALALGPLAAQAHQAGDFILRAGAVHVSTHENSSSVRVDRGALAGANLGGRARLDNDTQLGLNLAYLVTDHFAVELLGATPFRHDVTIRGTQGGIADGKLGRLKHLPPVLSALYYPMDNRSAFQPYLGVGINYTWFHDESIHRDARAAGFRNLRVDNSWGLAAQIGADYLLTDRIMLNLQVRYIDIDTRAYVNNVDLDVRARVNVDVKPWVYMAGIGYRF